MSITPEELEGIRARYEDDARSGVSPGSAFWQAHSDVGTLLLALTEAQERAERALKATRPYRAEFGAIFHEDQGGFLFTVSSEKMANEVAKALNISAALRAALNQEPTPTSEP